MTQQCTPGRKMAPHELNITRVVVCPDPDNVGTVDVGDCTSCDYYEGIDEHNEVLNCSFGGKT